MAKEKKEGLEYSAKQITVLEGLEPVRKRPGMYIGSTGPEGLHHLIWEVVDNCFDEAMGGHADHVTIALLPDNRVSVSDNGRGIPTDLHPQYKVSALELVLTKLHAGGKFGGDSGYKISGGLHGVGVSVVNALSTWLKAEVHRDGEVWEQEFKTGKPIYKAKKVGKAKDHGTTISFEPDASIFTTVEFDPRYILDHLRQQAYLTKGILVTISDERDTSTAPNLYSFYFEGGVASYVRHLNHTKEPKHENVFYMTRETDGVQLELGLQYTEDYSESVFAFTNNIYNLEGGTHVAGFRSALTRVLNTYARNKGYLKEKDDNLSGDDVREGLTTVISVKVREPQFEGQTKAKLGNPEVKGAVESAFGEAFTTYLEEHPKDGEKIMEKCVLAARARAAARAARDTVLRKGALEGMTLPGKLADCSSREPDLCEMFIVEGDSAGGSAKQGRNREFQAILPLRGKILNVERARLDKMLANNEVKNMVVALGTSIGESFSIDSLRYNRVIIMTDADVDGAHIRTLLLTLFYRYFPDLITAGHIFIAQPPLYRLAKGKQVTYAYSDDEKEEILKRLLEEKEAAKPKAKAKEEPEAEEPPTEEDAGEEKTVVGGVAIQRYKGLGEMNPEQLWETTMNPASRVLKQVQIDDAEKADQTFDILMGNKVEPRKLFIQSNAKGVKNLDI